MPYVGQDIYYKSLDSNSYLWYQWSKYKIKNSYQKTIKLMEKYDLDAYTYSSGLGQIFFIMAGESWSDLQKKIEKRNASKEWNQYWMGINKDPSGNFVRAAYSVRVN